MKGAANATRPVPSFGDIKRMARKAGDNPWFRPMRIYDEQFRYFGMVRFPKLKTETVLLDLWQRGFLIDDGSCHGLDLMSDSGDDLCETIPLSREGMRFIRKMWALRIEPLPAGAR